MLRTPVKPHEFLVGKPMPFDVYDRDGRLLLRRGYVIETKEEKEKLLKLGPERDVRTDERLRAVLSSAERITEAGTEEARRSVTMAFADLRLMPGEILQVQLDKDGERLLTRYIGMVRNRSLFIEPITRSDLPVYVREGSALQIKGTTGSYAFAFVATLTANIAKPFAYHHLSYPPEVRALRLRRTDRHEVRLVCAILEEGKEAHGGIIHDLSLGGAFVTARHEMKVGQQITLKFKIRIADTDVIITTPAVVRSVRHSANAEEGQGYGVQFTDLAPEDTLALMTYLRAVQSGMAD